MPKKRDSQRNAVYKWERRVPGFSAEPDLTLSECQALVNRIWARYGRGSAPVCSDGRGRKHPGASRWGIKLPRASRTKHITIHEVTHSLLREYFDPLTIAAHGPEFARVMLNLLAEFAGVNGAKAHHLGVTQTPRRVKFYHKDLLKQWRKEKEERKLAACEL